jgi:Cu/Ag efflux protein CusF
LGRLGLGIGLAVALFAMGTPAAATATSTAATAASATAAAAAGAASAATGRGIGVADDETAAHEPFDIVDARALNERNTFRVDQDVDRFGFNDNVVVAYFVFNTQHVLQGAAGSGHNHYPEHVPGLVLFGQYLDQLAGS